VQEGRSRRVLSGVGHQFADDQLDDLDRSAAGLSPQVVMDAAPVRQTAN
jgi:hypothetical protein